MLRTRCHAVSPDPLQRGEFYNYHRPVRMVRRREPQPGEPGPLTRSAFVA
jgi:hypothetical protein